MNENTEPAAAGERNLEECLRELEETIRTLEESELPLEESFRLYQKGMELVRICDGKIDRVEKKVLKLNEEGKPDEF
ncbi:MAG: exodeoxyribonuclease VII small subunit [Lachnospiraceae bacterium]|nr:exodeoxyribonuclease VII small subunit [Lachnospiraceae bacterium]